MQADLHTKKKKSTGGELVNLSPKSSQQGKSHYTTLVLSVTTKFGRPHSHSVWEMASVKKKIKFENISIMVVVAIQCLPILFSLFF